MNVDENEDGEGGRSELNPGAVSDERIVSLTAVGSIW